ncbi:hypothetical protein DH2020_040802 [Rehmannia glutinosa]|uniref:Uncharacterized protein n=1 Tax=Rehmannia glutinosa TaxID=99300 RepID=A0ABR0US04_REHGL
MIWKTFRRRIMIRVLSSTSMLLAKQHKPNRRKNIVIPRDSSLPLVRGTPGNSNLTAGAVTKTDLCQYTVRSGYKILVKSIIDEQLGIEWSWGKIWKLKIPAKVKFFLWRACRNCLPTIQKSVNKGMDVTRISKLWSVVNRVAGNVELFASWFFTLLEETTSLVSARICMLLWNTWKQRNAKLWRNNHTNSKIDNKIAASFWTCGFFARLSPSITMVEATPQSSGLWHPPPISILKCNINPGFFQEINRVGVGMVLRDDTGTVLMCHTLWFMGDIYVLEGDSIGLFEGLKWVQALGFSNVIFEVDANGVVDALQSNEEIWNEVGRIIRSSKAILESEPSYKVQFVYRQANVVAHVLARVSTSYASHTIWVEPLDFVVAHLGSICNLHCA